MVSRKNHSLLSIWLVAFVTISHLTINAFATGNSSTFGNIKKRGYGIRARYESVESAKRRPIKYDSSPDARLSPVILIPGDGGSRLQAKLNRNEVLHYYCEKKSNDWFDLWLNLSLLVPFALECWMDNMRLVYNETSRRTFEPPGVQVRVSGFGSTDSVEFVDPAKVRGTGYYDGLVKQLVSLGYERNVNIFGAPYDFRKAPNELVDYFNDLTKLIETAYNKNNETVVLICHSMGCYNSLHFLQQKDQAWKDKYVRSMISLAGVWGGSVKAMKAFTSGDNFGVMVIPSLSLRRDFRTFPSLAYLLPNEHVWSHDEVLLEHNDKQYTIKDYETFFNDIQYPVGYQMWLDTKNLTSPLVAPNVEIHCLHGSGVSTIENLKYTSIFPDGKPDMKFGNGDGTVNLKSLEACKNWSNNQQKPVHHKAFDQLDHMTIMNDNQVLDYIGEALFKD